MALFTISADSHITEPADCYADRIDPKFRDRAPVGATDDTMGAVMDIDNGRSRIPYGMIAAAGRPAESIHPFMFVGWDELHQGGWDPAARLTEQDRDGVSTEILYPSVGMLLCNHPDVDFKKACFDAYNLWITEFQSHAPARLVGLGQTALRSVEEGVDDLQHIAELGLRGAMLPGYAGCHADGDYDDHRWDPLWRAAVELDMPLSFHILTTGVDEMTGGKFRGPKMNSFLGIIRGCQDIIGTLIFGGVFERHPELRVVCVEADAGWVPHWMYRADHAFDRHRNWLSADADLTRPPSEYFRENVYVTFQDDLVAFRVTDLLNHERLMWANDHPHSDSTWPDSQAVIAEHTAHLTPPVRDDILWRNCARLYNLDVPTSIATEALT
ncbi:MAG: amidohydrolase [Acidimicrobiia bacterium]|nr:amidohydrolase [Acidimicrobiia bacterium]